MNSVLKQLFRGIIITGAILGLLIGFFVINLLQFSDRVFENTPQNLQIPLKKLGSGRFVFGYTNHNISLCDTSRKNKNPVDTRNCLGDYIQSINIIPPYVYLYFVFPIQKRINPDFFNVKKGEEAIMEFPLFGPEDILRIDAYDKVPNYIKINFENGEKWTYGERDMPSLSSEDRVIFEKLKKVKKIVLDGKEYSNQEYEGMERKNTVGYYFASKDPNATGKPPFLPPEK